MMTSTVLALATLAASHPGHGDPSGVTHYIPAMVALVFGCLLARRFV